MHSRTLRVHPIRGCWWRPRLDFAAPWIRLASALLALIGVVLTSLFLRGGLLIGDEGRSAHGTVAPVGWRSCLG